jgi:hypothetical protein
MAQIAVKWDDNKSVNIIPNYVNHNIFAFISAFILHFCPAS